EPVEALVFSRSCPGGAEESPAGASFAPPGRETKRTTLFHGLRVGGLRRAAAPPVATIRGPFGAKPLFQGVFPGLAWSAPSGQKAKRATSKSVSEGRCKDPRSRFGLVSPHRSCKRPQVLRLWADH